MPLHRLTVAAVVLAFAVLAPDAGAATLQTDRSCYLEQTSGNPVTVVGTGFVPRQPYQLLIDGQPLGAGTADAAGNVAGTFDLGADRLGPKLDEHTYTLSARQGAITADTRITVTKFAAGFRPIRGNPKTMRVRFRVVGFGLDPAKPRPAVYVHYIRPDGKLVRTIRLGRTVGSCGKIRRTKLRRLFPFSAVRGNWRLQFDTTRSFTEGTANSTFSFYTIGVRIRRLA